MTFGREPWSAATHFVGLVAAIAGLVHLVILSAANPAKETAMSLYGGALVALFLCSTLYHFLDLGPRGNRWLRRLDHSAIFLLIAGSYMPPFFHLLDGPLRVTMIAVVGGIAVLGILVKLLWIGSPSWIGLALYLTLGWIVLVPGWWMLPRIAGGSLALLVAGGVAYTLGAGIYAARRPDPWPDVFGHHEVWHLFVLAGAGLHYAFVVTLISTPVPAF